MKLKPQLDEFTAAKNMAEIEPPLTGQQAQVESERCLYCFDAPCITACPTGIDIPGFIKKIANDNLTGSAKTILEANILGSSCARVCPTSVLCEGACVLLDRDEMPIKIGQLQRHATDHVIENDIQVLKAPEVRSGKKVALIGGGPASMGCAAELVLLGHEAVIYEKSPEAGGLNTYGIAYYKLPPRVSLEEVEMIQKLGVQIECGVEIGKDLSMDELRADFDAIFLGVGLGNTRSLGVPGEDLPEVTEALTFIETFHVSPLHETPVGRHVVVVGCGNTAIDAVTQAKRLGAETATIVYRRGEEDMPAYRFEYELAKKDGCSFLFHVAPVKVLGEGSVSGLRLIRTQLTADGAVEPITGSEFEIPCDMVIKASGQEKRSNFLQSLCPDLSLDRASRLEVDPMTRQTSVAGIYAGGDAVNGGREVVNAVAEGKKAARGMHLEFTGETVEGPLQHTRMGSSRPIGSGFDNPVRVSEAGKS